ncbi:hypothetical protein GCM10009864_47120 [Streptomyces lunalinharesii]|uniref:Uncharacterized protein n=1 Tax=Streptomyces lunalinharesii TaxID=333384 RepID=A0ABP6ERR5_9ACTN
MPASRTPVSDAYPATATLKTIAATAVMAVMAVRETARPSLVPHDGDRRRSSSLRDRAAPARVCTKREERIERSLAVATTATPGPNNTTEIRRSRSHSDPRGHVPASLPRRHTTRVRSGPAVLASPRDHRG